MRPLARLTAVASATALAGLLTPSVASADVVGEITVTASVTGNDVNVTVTDNVVGDEYGKGCEGVAIVDPSDDEGPWPSAFAVVSPNLYNEELPVPILPFGGSYTHTFTDVPDGEWAIHYFCVVVDPALPAEDNLLAYWITGDVPEADPPIYKNREPIIVTVPSNDSEPPDDPGCFGSSCLFTGSN